MKNMSEISLNVAEYSAVRLHYPEAADRHLNCEDRGVVKVFLLLLWTQETPGAANVQQPPPAERSTLLDPVQGTIRVKYRYRSTSTESDSDLYEVVNLLYGHPEKDVVSAALSLRLAEDTDGNKNVQGFYPFTSLDDHYRSWATSRLYTAYLDYRPEEGRLLVRAGRQILEEFPEAVPMDGALGRYHVAPQVTLSVFAGLPVNPYEASPSGDVMGGGSVEWTPAPDGRARYRVEYLHLRDDNTFGLHKDDLFGLSFEEGSGPFTVYARYTMLEWESRDLVGRVSAGIPDAQLQVQLQGTYVFHQIQALSYPIDPYASILMDLEPYVDLTLLASKGFGNHVAVDALFTSRQLVHDAVESTYNHDFKRVEVAPSLRNWPLDGLTVRAAADFWNSTGDDFWTLGGDVSMQVHRDIVLSAGTSYALYTVDAFTGEEHDRVRLFTFSLRWQVQKASTIEARFTIETNDIDTFHILEVGFRHAF